jgi:hypothetical protein
LDIPVLTAQKDTLARKRIVLQTIGWRNKMKAHKEVPHLALTKDDAESVAEKVQD